ncbi:hypothetical protein [Mucilaginibacter gotjawali]|uniref:Uncharacterized protein n=2 Tax=Mucilaginibacter gotjawali TaxID=1550579 RepID=A0A120MYS1_9SPHI|nr:hypothetical protein [Mucilaginibacter gotjawali]MBB3056060.1 hypothetical protein [Mucilaginibacter gotjawali]BAU53603.1 hypothetical protein MgSA37_01772 [Mucilaginibacter gotjawali]
MIKQLLLITLVFLTLNVHGQTTDQHYIKFLHVGERILPVHTLNISTGTGEVPRDSVEIINDTLQVISYVTDEKSFNILADYIHDAHFHLSSRPGRLEFGTFKVIKDGKYYYLPDVSATDYFKKMIRLLKKKDTDPMLINAIIDNYQWIFNP